MFNLLRAVAATPSPAGPPQSVKRLDPAEPTISKAMRAEGRGWAIELDEAAEPPMFSWQPPLAEA